MLENKFKLFQKVTPYFPKSIRRLLRSFVSLSDYDMARRRERNPYADSTGETFESSSFQLGIFKDLSHYHKHYIAACQELEVSYRVLDLMADDWIEQVRDSKCDAFLAWPSSCSTVAKSVFDQRLRILEEDLGGILYPSAKECWLTEHKPRLRDWLDTHGIAHPRTWVFYSEKVALEFAETVDLPIVSKTATGASGSGVMVIKLRSELVRLIRTAFGRGQCPEGYDPLDRQRGFVFLQEYLPDVQEWRMVRIGDSYFGHKKGLSAKGLHSGASSCEWVEPGVPLLELLENVTDIGGFKSMDVDVFQTRDGKLLINECQTVFGCSIATTQMKINGVEGRYLHEGGLWRFEPGGFCRNHMCNLRVKYLLYQLKLMRTA